MTKVLYAGSFDPITKGHMDLINQATDMFDEVVVAVMQNAKKGAGLFTLEERMEMIREIYKDVDNVNVVTGQGATVQIAILNECKALLRGARNGTDFDAEIQMQQINKDLTGIKTVCLFADKDYQYVSSSAVRELYNLDMDYAKYVDPVVAKRLVKKKEGN